MELKEARAQLDQLDRQIQELFVQRMELVSKIGAYKREHKLDTFDPTREAEQLRAAAERGGPVLGDYNRRLMESMLELSREYQNATLQAEQAARARRKD